MVQISHIWGRQILNYETIYDPLLCESGNTLETSKFTLLFHLTPADVTWDRIEKGFGNGGILDAAVFAAPLIGVAVITHISISLFCSGIRAV